MPTGYVYHDKEFKSANPPEPESVSSNQRRYMGREQAQQLRDAVYDLAEALTRRAGLPPRSVYVLSPQPLNGFYAQIDNDLRESLRHLGYTLADKPEGSYIFAYSAQELSRPSVMAKDPTPLSVPNLILSILVFDRVTPDRRLLTHQTDHYYIKGIETYHVVPIHPEAGDLK